MSVTDIIVIIAVGVFSLIGFLKGFVRTAIGPISSILGLYGGYSYYLKTQKLLPALAIAILGPVALSLAASGILFLWRKKFTSDPSLSSTSRILGGLFNAAWGLCIFAPLLLFVAIIPTPIEQLATVKNDVLESSFYAAMKYIVDRKFSFVNGVEALLKNSEDPAQLEVLQSKPEYTVLRNDPRFQDLANDEETIRQIRERDFVKLMTNQKFIDILKDKEAVKKLLELSKSLGEKPPQKESPPATPPSSFVKVYELKDGSKVGERQDGTMEVIH